MASLDELRADLLRRLAKFLPMEESSAAATSSLSTTSPTASVPQPATPEEAPAELVMELHAVPELSMPAPARCSTECQDRVSLFQELELELGYVDEVFKDTSSKDMASDEELADIVLTHVGGWSLFIEHDVATDGQFQGNIRIDKRFDQGLGVSKLLPSTGCTQGAISICSSRPDILSHTIKQMKARVCSCQSLLQFNHKSPLQLAEPIFFHPGIFLTEGDRLVLDRIPPWDRSAFSPWLGNTMCVIPGEHEGPKECQIELLLNIMKQDFGPASILSIQAAHVFMSIHGSKMEANNQWELEHIRYIKKVVNPVLRSMGIFQYVHDPSLALICWCQMGMVLNCTNSNLESKVHTGVAIGLETSADVQLTEVATYFQSLGNTLMFPSACPCWSLGTCKKGKGYMSWHLQVQGLSKCRNLCPFSGMASDLEYKQWDPGISQKVFECFSNQDRQIISARFLVCLEYPLAALSLCRPHRAIAWGQAMFLGGGNVMTVHVDALGFVVMGLGPAYLRERWCIGVYTREERVSEGIEDRKNTGRSRPLSRPLPLRPHHKRRSPPVAALHKRRYPEPHAPVITDGNGVCYSGIRASKSSTENSPQKNPQIPLRFDLEAMEVATTTTEAHLSAIHQSLLQISATLGRMLTYGCVNATSSPDAVVPAKCSTVGLNPNIGAVEVVDSSQQSGIVSTVNPGLVGAPPSSTMQWFGILKSGKHTPTTCSTGVLDVDTDAKNAKRDAGTLQAGLSVHVPWDPGVCNDAYSICQEKTSSHLQGVRGCVLYVWALANQLKELQLPLQCIPIEIDQTCSLVIWSITISWDPGILQQIVRQASRPRKLDVQGVMFLHTIMLQQKLGDWCDPGMTFPMCSSFSGIGTTSTCLVFVQLTHMSAAVYSTTGNMLSDPREAAATCEIPLPRAPPDIVEISDDCISNLVMLSVIAMSWDPGVNNQQIMCTHQELEREIDKSTRLDHVIAGLELVFMEIPSEEGKLQQIVSKDMENYVSQWTLLLPQGWQDVQMIIQPTSSKTIELIFSQRLDFRSTTVTFPWDPGNWLWVLQLITSAQFLCLANLSCWSAHSSISWCDMRVWLYLSLYAPEQSTCFRSFPVYMVHLHSGGSGILLGAIEQWNEALKARHAYVMEDPLKTLVTVTWLHTYCSVFCDIHSEGWERKLQWLPWNLSVHNQVIRQGQQELCKCYYLCSLIHMANHLQYKQWDPGVTWIVGAEGIKLYST